MNHPGPPQFMAVGETVQVAPRDPDPEATYSWRVKSAPVSSQLSFDEDDPIVDFTPDTAGTFVLELTGPLGVDELTIRAFPSELAPVGRGAGSSGQSGVSGISGVSGVSGVSGSSGISGLSGSGSGARGAEKKEGDSGRPRVQLHGSVEGDTVVVRADPQPNPNSSTPRDELTVEFLVDDRWPVDDSRVEVDGWTLTMPVDAFEEKTRVHAVAIDAEYSVADALEVRVKGTTVDFGDGARTDGGVATQAGEKQVETGRLYEPPEWSKDVTLYEIYVRGFASDDDEAENTFAALEKRLDYLADLGVDCLWLTPVLQNDHAPHGYNIVDFYNIAEDLGDMEAYQAFVDAAHDHGMRVMFDLVLNHSARAHPYFQDAYKNPDSEYYDWYEWQESGEPETYFEWEYIANFDYHNLEVRRYLLDAVQQWFEIVDGFRCDMAWAVPFTFWQELRDRVKSQDPDFLLLDETIPYIADFHEGMFDMHFDTTLYFTLRQVGNGNQPADAILDAMEQRTEVGFPDHASFMLYQENHDETRYLVECGDEAAFASAGALFTLPGVPMLYGGQELGQRGRRDPLSWDDAREEIQEHYKHLIRMRSETPALNFRGGIDRVEYEASTEKVTVFRREAKGQSVLVALNFGDAPATVEIDAELEGANLLNGKNVLDDGTVSVESVAVLEER